MSKKNSLVRLSKHTKLIQESCEVCPTYEDAWLEARLHPLVYIKFIVASVWTILLDSTVRLFLLMRLILNPTPSFPKSRFTQGTRTKPHIHNCCMKGPPSNSRGGRGYPCPPHSCLPLERLVLEYDITVRNIPKLIAQRSSILPSCQRPYGLWSNDTWT